MKRFSHQPTVWTLIKPYFVLPPFATKMPPNWFLAIFALSLCLYIVVQTVRSRQRQSDAKEAARRTQFRALNRFVRGRKRAGHFGRYLRLTVVALACMGILILACGIALGSTTLYVAAMLTISTLIFGPAIFRTFQSLKRPSMAQIMLLVTCVAVAFAFLSQIVENRQSILFALLGIGSGCACFLLSQVIALNFQKTGRRRRIPTSQTPIESEQEP